MENVYVGQWIKATARLEKLAVISKSLVSNVRPAEKTWTGEINEQSALQQDASTQKTCSDGNISRLLGCINVKRGIIPH